MTRRAELDGAARNRRFRPWERLRQPADFDAVFRSGASSAGAVVIVRGKPNGLEFSRLGVSVGRRFGNAVARNRFKRLCREAYRHVKADLSPGWDWVVLPKQNRIKGSPRTSVCALTQIEIAADLVARMKKVIARSEKGLANERIPPAPGLG